MEGKKLITQEKKQENFLFDFFINLVNSDKFIHDFLGTGKVPLIGHYNHNEYTFGDILSLITFSYEICKGASHKEINNNYSDFIPPNAITEYLNVNEKISIDNNTKIPNSNAIFYPKEKIQFHFIISSIPSNSNKKEIKDYNIVPHMVYLNDDLNFSKVKRITFNNAICMFDTEPNKNFIKINTGKNDIDLNNLRLEYSSVHYKKGSLCFSPNNMRFMIDKNEKFSQFYLIITLPEKDCHLVYYYIICNDNETKDIVKQLLKNSINLKEIIEKFKNMFPNNIDIINNLNSLFKI